jgi:hypothetical protein
MTNKFKELSALNVNEHTEKKGNLTYLSWAWAVTKLLENDPQATWSYAEPKLFGQSMMVFCTVNAFGKSMTAQLPVLDFKNKAIASPDAMAVNTAMQRCLAKAIALHGIGLYIYAGEDLPDGEEVIEDKPKVGTITTQQIASINSLIAQTGSDEAKLCAYFKKPAIALFDRMQATNAIVMLEKKLQGVSNVGE